MKTEHIHKEKELVSILMESSLYFNFTLGERLKLIKDLLPQMRHDEPRAEINAEASSPQAL